LLYYVSELFFAFFIKLYDNPTELRFARLCIALCANVASQSRFAQLWPVYRASRSWHRQKIRLWFL